MDHYNHEFTRQLDAIDQLTEAFLKYKIKLFESKHNEPDLRMNPTKYHILKAIYQCGSCMVVDISRQLQLSSGATTISLNQLEQDELIVRLRSKEDRRTVKTTLTDKGKRVIEEAMHIRNQLLVDMLEPLTPEEQEQFFRLTEKIAKQLSKKIEAPNAKEAGS